MVPQPAESGMIRHGRATRFNWDDWRTVLMVAWAIGVAALLALWLLPLGESDPSDVLMIARAAFFVLYGTWAVLWLLERYQTGEDAITHMEVGAIGRGVLRVCTFVFWALVMAFLVAGESGVDSLTTPARVAVFGAGGAAALGRIVITCIANIQGLRRKRDENLDALVNDILAGNGSGGGI